MSRRFAMISTLLAGLLAYGGLVGAANAMSVTPIHVEMVSVGKTSRTQISVHNNGRTPLPVETMLERLSLDEQGNRKLAKAGAEFLVFPPQAMIRPGGTQVFRLQWVGEPMLAKSQSYMFTVSQVPVRLKNAKNKVQVVMAFGAVVNVSPPRAAPRLKVVKTGMTTDGRGNRRAYVTVENPTKYHALLPDGRLSLTGAGWSHTMSQSDMSEKLGIGLVQPGKRRKFVLPVAVPRTVNTVQARLDYRAKR